jgi:hypothetical protein
MVFGEYIPYYEQLGKTIKQLIPETSNFARGTDVTVFPLNLPSGTAQIGPMVCYEDIFPSFGRRLTLKDPNLFINITNDAWFGRTSEPYEHLALSVYRAVEARVDLVRAVNTGVSVFVDSTGRVYAQSPSVDPDETPDAKPVALLEEVAVQQPFKLYATLGEWFGGLCMLVLGLLGLSARSRVGRPVRWRLVTVGAAALFATILVIVAVASGPSRLGLALQLITHRTLPDGSGAAAFSTGLLLAPAIALGSILCSLVVTRTARASAPLESALAILVVLVLPALAIGTLEGEQAGLVLTALAAIGLGRLGDRLLGRRVLKAARPSAGTAT